jgi:hypothetical protein
LSRLLLSLPGAFCESPLAFGGFPALFSLLLRLPILAV